MAGGQSCAGFGHKKTRLEKGGSRAWLKANYSSKLRRSQRCSNFELHFPPDFPPGVFGALGPWARFMTEFIKPPKLVIANTAPTRERTKPAIPRGGVCEIKPPKSTKMPNKIRPNPITTRVRLGVFPLNVEIRRGSSAARACSISANKRFSCSERGMRKQ